MPVKHYIGISKTARQSMSPLSQSRMAICRLSKKGGVEMKNATKVLVFFLIAAIVTVPSCGVKSKPGPLGPSGSSLKAQEETARKETSAEEIAVDILLVRPLGLAALAVGAILSLVALPWSLLGGGDHKEVHQKLVVEPAKFTFTRPMGDI